MHNEKLGKFFIIIFLLLIGLLATLIILIKVINDKESKRVTEIYGYNELNYSLEKVAKNTELANHGEFGRTIENLNKAKNGKNINDQYLSLENSFSHFNALYSQTNNQSLYKILPQFGKIAKANFPQNYKEANFSFFCQDPSCSDSSQPKEILKIVEEINNSDFPDNVKKTTARDVLNIGYITSKNRAVRALSYLSMVEVISSYGGFSSSSANIEIASDLKKYVTKEYSNEMKNNAL